MKSGLVVVDKPMGITSHDAVARCRRIFGTRKVGHAGTLDPMATGVLVIGIERATKILGLLTTTAKSYQATIRLGQATTTDDADGEIVKTSPTDAVTDDQIASAIAALTGEIRQTPSAVSAVKIGGTRAYRLVRAGRAVDIPARAVRVDRFDVRAIRRNHNDKTVDVDVEVDCSSGTYVRALARDVGGALGVGGHLTELRRTRVGAFTQDGARTLDALEDHPRLTYSLDQACLMTFPRRDITAEEALAASHGRPLQAAGIRGVYVATAPDGRVVALLRDRDNTARPVTVLRPATLP
ncbi:MAG TPA: tRNA pseudouridine(55) synthase TruB [Mycobacterium sp.]|nr:tRNA pseudouridine(55) synthase TruB [Mycobacterium sp.]